MCTRGGHAVLVMVATRNATARNIQATDWEHGWDREAENIWKRELTPLSGGVGLVVSLASRTVPRESSAVVI